MLSSVLALVCLAYSQRAAAAKSSCSTIDHTFQFPNTAIIGASAVAASANFSTPGSCQSTATASTSSFCRIQLVVNTTSTSVVHIEAWLPDQWNHRLLSLGNAGLGGCIDYANLAYGTSLEFASIGSDNGHDGDSGAVFLNNPEVINDFAYRAIHTEVLVGKALVKAYYKTAHRKSYYLGCSTGGRQGVHSAELYPEDFDGIVGGCPAANFNDLTSWQGFLSTYIGAAHQPANATAEFIPPAQWDAISAEILNQCDMLDGVKDGIITEPDECHFQPKTLLCGKGSNSNAATCLTPTQVGVLDKIYSPFFGDHGDLINPRLEPGAEADGQWEFYFGGPIFPIAGDWFKYVIYNNSDYDFANFDLASVYLADAINPGGIATWSGDLTKFMQRGGKFLTYHGRRDQIISGLNSKRLYNHISNVMHMPSLDSFYRLFLIPGMEHCAGGQGAWAFGQTSTAAIINNPSHNILLALVDWVENGKAPATITGSIPGQSNSDRVHCRYPAQISVFKGGKWTCQPA